MIPHIIDLRDTMHLQQPRSSTSVLTAEQLNLFLAIEQPDEDARKDIDPDKVSKYFPTAPFAGWQVETDPLPMFGTIGWMYECYYDYLKLRLQRRDHVCGTHVYTSRAVSRTTCSTTSYRGTRCGSSRASRARSP